jgi:predicted small integral membrane protein
LPLDPRFRFAIYGAFSILFVTGVAWIVSDQMKDAASGEPWQMTAAYMLMVHGGAAMATLMLLGALVPLHVRHGWRMRRNRITGSLMAACNAALILTAFGLYYLGSDTFRSWTSGVHIGAGLFFPVLFCIHVFIGRRGP